MSDLGFDGMVRVDLAPAIADLDSPTVAELAAAVPLTPRLTPDGLSISSDTAEVPNSKLLSTFDTATVGRTSYTISLTYMRGPSSDTEAAAVEAALIKGATGVLVVRRDVVNTLAYAAAQKVELYPAQVKTPTPGGTANQNQTVVAGLTVTATPKSFDDRATVAA